LQKQKTERSKALVSQWGWIRDFGYFGKRVRNKHTHTNTNIHIHIHTKRAREKRETNREKLKKKKKKNKLQFTFCLFVSKKKKKQDRTLGNKLISLRTWEDFLKQTGFDGEPLSRDIDQEFQIPRMKKR